MDASDKQVFLAAIGCILALTLWKGSRENWFLSLCGLIVIAATIHFANETGFPLNLLVWGAGFVVLGVGKYLVVDLSWAEINRGFKEFLNSRVASTNKESK